jgi:hypothetical protein
LAQFLGLDLLLPLQFFYQQFGVVSLMINPLVSTFFLNFSQINDVLSYADTDGDRLLEVAFHLDELAIVVYRLQVTLLLSVVFLVLDALCPLDRKIFKLSPVLFINLVCIFIMLLFEIGD